MADRVVAKVAALDKAWKRADRGGFWMALTTRHRDIEAFRRALASAVDREGDDGIDTQLDCGTPTGYATMVEAVPSSERLATWLDALADDLTAKGFTGTLEPTRSVPWAPWLTDSETGWSLSHRWSPAAFTLWTADYSRFTEYLDNPSQTGEWPDPDTIEHRCAEGVAWVAPGGPALETARGTFVFALANAADLPGMLTAAARAQETSTTACSDPPRRRGRELVLRSGTAIHQVLGEVDHWHDRIDPLRQAITTAAGDIDLAFVRTVSPGILGWDQIQGRYPREDLHGGQITVNRHLVAEYVYDAHGLQVLRDAHLDKAHDLRDWTTTSLGHGRHLVEARDLAAWYATEEGADADTVARARTDFGAMLLTRDTITQRPAPWSGRSG